MQAQQPEVEAVRDALRALGPSKARALAVRLGLAPETVSKFRRGHIAEPGAGKFFVLREALLPKPAAKAKRGKKAPRKAKPDNGMRRRATDKQGA